MSWKGRKEEKRGGEREEEKVEDSGRKSEYRGAEDEGGRRRQKRERVRKEGREK